MAALTAAVTVPPVLFGHRGAHATMNLILPGAGLYGSHRLAAITLFVLAVAATAVWLRWGTDWVVALVTAVAMASSAVFATAPDTAAPTASRAAHEFPLVILVMAALGWLRSAAPRVPGLRWLLARGRRRVPTTMDALPPVVRCRVVATRALAGVGDQADADAVDADDVRRRARLIGLAARARRGGDPLRVDHAHARAALALCDRLDDDQRRHLRADATRSWAGVPCSEPGWIRPFDATLAALATGDPELAARWGTTLRSTFALRRGHRPARAWSPLAISAGRAPDWEHAAVTAIGRATGWLSDDRDWDALRQRALGAAARGVEDPGDERFIAAARCWVALVDDERAAAVLARPTIRHDPLALALDNLATRIAVFGGLRVGAG